MTSTGNINADELFFGMVNEHRDAVNHNAELEAQMKNKVDFIAKAVQKSISNTDIIIEYNRQVEKNRKANQKLVAILLAASLFLGVSATIAGRTINEHMKINAVQIRAERSIDGFLAYTGSMANSNSYNKIDGNDIVTIYILKDKLTAQEFEAFIRTKTYVVPDSGEIKHYNNFSHYLSVEGFDSEREFKRAAEEAMLAYYNENDLLNYYSTIDVNAPTKGGR